jgi:hypothetical protein
VIGFERNGRSEWPEYALSAALAVLRSCPNQDLNRLEGGSPLDIRASCREFGSFAESSEGIGHRREEEIAVQRRRQASKRWMSTEQYRNCPVSPVLKGRRLAGSCGGSAVDGWRDRERPEFLAELERVEAGASRPPAVRGQLDEASLRPGRQHPEEIADTLKRPEFPGGSRC